MRPGEIRENRMKPGGYIAIISAEVLPGRAMGVRIAQSEAYAADEASPFHTLGTTVQGWLIPTSESLWRRDDLGNVADMVEPAALEACRELFQAALAN